MNVRIHNRQRRAKVDPVRLRALARALHTQPDGLPPPELDVLHLLLTDHEGMRDAHTRVFGHPKDTDVVSLMYAPMPGADTEAEIVLNVEQALDEGMHRTGGPPRELALYLAHGLDHLRGADDDTPQARACMLQREQGWLHRLGETHWHDLITSIPAPS